MGKKAKEHRKKVAKRNEQIKIQQNRVGKAQKEFLMKLIEQEKQKGLFDSQVMSLPNLPLTESPTLSIPIIGPQI